MDQYTPIKASFCFPFKPGGRLGIGPGGWFHHVWSNQQPNGSSSYSSTKVSFPGLSGTRPCTEPTEVMFCRSSIMVTTSQPPRPSWRNSTRWKRFLDSSNHIELLFGPNQDQLSAGRYALRLNCSRTWGAADSFKFRWKKGPRFCINNLLVRVVGTSLFSQTCHGTSRFESYSSPETHEGGGRFLWSPPQFYLQGAGSLQGNLDSHGTH